MDTMHAASNLPVLAIVHPAHLQTPTQLRVTTTFPPWLPTGRSQTSRPSSFDGLALLFSATPILPFSLGAVLRRRNQPMSSTRERESWTLSAVASRSDSRAVHAIGARSGANPLAVGWPLVPLLLAAVPFAASTMACRKSASTVAADVRGYLAQVQQWATIEAETNRTISRVLHTQFVDEGEVRHEIADNRPDILDHLDRIRAYTPRTSSLQKLHQRYIAAWEHLLGAYAAIEAGFASGDYSNLARGRKALLRWRDAMREIAKDLRTLADDAGVTARPT